MNKQQKEHLNKVFNLIQKFLKNAAKLTNQELEFLLLEVKKIFNSNDPLIAMLEIEIATREAKQQFDREFKKKVKFN